jgi:(S)-3,5-dihydroxyphenylglycine transaminase
MTTNNTSHFSQAMVGGYLVENGYSIKPLLKAKLVMYQNNMTTLSESLHKHLGGIPGVTWNEPEGGFFVILNLPFALSQEDLHLSASEYGVIWLPVNFFKVDGSSPKAIRLAYGNLTPEQIEQGVARLSLFLNLFISKAECAS